MSGEMDVHPVRFELDFEDLKVTEGYNPPDDFLIRVLPLDAGGALPSSEKTRDRLWYEYPSPLEKKTWDLQLQEETKRQLQLERESLRRSLEEREPRRQQLEVDMHQRRFTDERQHLEDEHVQEQDELYLDEMWANSVTSKGWGPADETPTCSSSSPARDALEEHQVLHVEEHQFHVEEHQVHVKMYEYDAADIPRYRLFMSEANTQELLLEFPLKIPYYIYAGRCNLKLEGYMVPYADLFPNFRRWNYTWVRPTTYEGDCQFVDFFAQLMREAEYRNTKDRVLAKAISIANKVFQKILYFQIELAVEDCMMLLEEEEKFKQRCNLYGYIASEIYFEKLKYESVLERITNGHEGFCYELTEFGSDANEDDELEMREFVDHLVKSTPIELPSTTKSDHVYKKWVSKQINLQFKPYFHLYENFLVKKINMAQDLELIPKDTS